MEALYDNLAEPQVDLTVPAACGDAIAEAARWCAAGRQLPGAPVLMAFGSSDVAYVLVGVRRSLRIHRYGDEPVAGDELWARIDEFSRVPGYIAGYLGFDAAWPDAVRRQRIAAGSPAAPTVYLFEPEGVIRIVAGETELAGPVVVQDAPVLAGLRPGAVPAGELLPLRPLDGSAGTFRSSVALTIDAIRLGKAQRLTIARRVDLPAEIDPLASFAVPPHTTGPDVARSFYLATGFIEMGGHSPELLARGDSRGFVCYKLSGTGPRGTDPASDARLRAGLLADPKIIREHGLSVESTRSVLAAVGAVDVGPMELVERLGIRHMMTPLKVATRPGQAWSDTLRAVLPAGAQPRAEGLAMLDILEPGTRAAYYGLIGLRRPDGHFEFSQVLRTLFRDATGVHTFVGAAVTDGSTADGESEETRLKLDDVVAVCPSPRRARVSGRSPHRGRP